MQFAPLSCMLQSFASKLLGACHQLAQPGQEVQTINVRVDALTGPQSVPRLQQSTIAMC